MAQLLPFCTPHCRDLVKLPFSGSHKITLVTLFANEMSLQSHK